MPKRAHPATVLIDLSFSSHQIKQEISKTNSVTQFHKNTEVFTRTSYIEKNQSNLFLMQEFEDHPHSKLSVGQAIGNRLQKRR